MNHAAESFSLTVCTYIISYPAKISINFMEII